MKTGSDPLPFTQVDRAVKPKAALLAGLLGVSNQHALGSLVEFWDLNGDPRVIEALAAAGTNELVLSREEAERRFRLASGKDARAADLVSLGLLEDRGDAVRVRGMSRYFEPVRQRLQARAAAAAGGSKSGSQPRTGGRFAARQPPERPPSGPPSDGPSVSRAGTEPGPTLEVRGQRSDLSPPSEEKEQASANPDSGPPRKLLIVDVEADAWWAWAQDVRAQALGVVRERPPHPRALGSWWSRALGELHGDVERLRAGWLAYLRDKHWSVKRSPWAGWLAQWEQFVPPAAPPPPPNEEHRAALTEALGAYEAHLLLITPGLVMRREGPDSELVIEHPDEYRRKHLTEALAPGSAVRFVEPSNRGEA